MGYGSSLARAGTYSSAKKAGEMIEAASRTKSRKKSLWGSIGGTLGGLLAGALFAGTPLGIAALAAGAGTYLGGKFGASRAGLKDVEGTSDLWHIDTQKEADTEIAEIIDDQITSSAIKSGATTFVAGLPDVISGKTGVFTNMPSEDYLLDLSDKEFASWMKGSTAPGFIQDMSRDEFMGFIQTDLGKEFIETSGADFFTERLTTEFPEINIKDEQGSALSEIVNKYITENQNLFTGGK